MRTGGAISVIRALFSLLAIWAVTAIFTAKLLLAAGEVKNNLFVYSPQEFCDPLNSFDVSDCRENLNGFVPVGNRCIRTVVSREEAVKQELNRQFSLGTSQQGNLLHSNSINDELTRQAARYMINVAAQAREEVINYKRHLFPPEDYDDPFIAGYSSQGDYLMNTACYANAKYALDEIQRQIEAIQKKYEAIEKIAFEKRNLSSGRETNLGAIQSPGVIVKNSKPAPARATGSPVVAAKKTFKKPASTITGKTEKIEIK